MEKRNVHLNGWKFPVFIRERNENENTFPYNFTFDFLLYVDM